MRHCPKKPSTGTIIFALIEICIGVSTIGAVFFSLIQGTSVKPPEVLIFVITTAFISSGIGIGLLYLNITCYHLLLFFSSMIILSKILIFAHIISLNGALETAFDPRLKNALSMVYHAAILFYFSRKPVRESFGSHKKEYVSSNRS